MVLGSRILAMTLFCCPRTKALLSCILLAASAGLAQAEERCPSRLRIGVLDYELAPLLVGKDKSAPPAGKLVDWLQQAVSKSACAPEVYIQRLPISRGRQLLFRGEIDIWGVAFPGTELITNSVLPMQEHLADPQLGFYLSSYFLYTTVHNTQVSWDGQQLSGPAEMRVGVAPVPALRAVLAERNWTPEPGLDTQNVLNKLLQGRSAVAILPEMLVLDQAKSVQQNLRKLTPPVLTSWYYAPVSQSLNSRHPQFVRSFWLELCRIGRADQGATKTPCRE